MTTYPNWICDDCGRKYGTWFATGAYAGPSSHCATYHSGKCDVCKDTDIPVTEPRDYGHLLDWDVVLRRIKSENNASKKHRKTRKANSG